MPVNRVNLVGHPRAASDTDLGARAYMGVVPMYSPLEDVDRSYSVAVTSEPALWVLAPVVPPIGAVVLEALGASLGRALFWDVVPFEARLLVGITFLAAAAPLRELLAMVAVGATLLPDLLFYATHVAVDEPACLMRDDVLGSQVRDLVVEVP